MCDIISIKGSREGLRVQLDETADWSLVVTELRSQIEQGGNFFAGARLIVDIGDRQVSEAQLAQALEVLTQHGLHPELLAASARESRNAAREAGLTTRPIAPLANTTNNHAQGSEALLLSRTVRSGQVIRHHGHITLIGDVNPGAEVIASGSVVVWGRLRGMVHAGALGDVHALICALELRPTQLRIANLIARTPEDTTSHVPEVAHIEQENIVVEAWESLRKIRLE